MRAATRLLACAIVGAVLGGCPRPPQLGPGEQDLKLICDFATRQVLEKGLTNASYVDFATRGSKLALSSPRMVEAWAAFLNASVESRYRFVEQAAQEAGLKGWSCEPLRRMSHVPGA